MNRAFDRDLLAEHIARVAQGDRAALDHVYRLTSAKIFGVCLRILNDKAEAEDVLQDTYLTLWRRADRFDPDRASPITWLVTIARNRAIDRLRAGRAKRGADPIEAAAELQDPAPSALDAVERADDTHRLETCLGELDEPQASALRAAFLDGLTYEELATRMDVPLGTMKSWIRRSLLKLRGCLER